MLRPPIVETLKKAKCGVGVSRRLAKYGGKEYSALVLGKANRWQQRLTTPDIRGP